MSEFVTDQGDSHYKPIDQGNLLQKRVVFSIPYAMQLFICLFLALVTLTTFWQVRNNEFINLDDDLYVTDNHDVQSGLTLRGILWAFTTTHAGQWQPITWLSHMLDHDLFGLNPGGHHMTSLLFHVANTLLLFLIFQRITSAPWRSGFVAALFALHPLRVESVAWVAERKDVLSAFFWILTMWAYVRYIERPELNRYLSVVLCFVLSLMSKPMAVTLPFVLLLLDYWPLNRLKFKKLVNTDQNRVPIFRLISEKVPLFLLTIALSLLTIFAQRNAGAVTSLVKLPLEIRIGNALISYVKYLAKMIWPDRLAVLYPHPIILSLWEVIGASLLLSIITVLMILAGRRRPYYIVGWLWYLGTLVPVIGLVQVGIQAMADRFTYIPFIGLFVIVVYGVSDILNGWRYRKVAITISGGLLLSILMTVTILQLQHWQNSIRLFNHTLQVTSNNYLIHNNLGVTLMRKGKDQEAFVHFMNALKIKPGYADAHYNLGSLLTRQGKDQEAVAHFGEALRIKPDKGEAYNDLGAIFFKQGKIQEAMVHFAEAMHINPNYAPAYFNLGTLLIKQGRKEEAIPYLNEALRINPKDAKIHNNLAVVLDAVGKVEEAIAHYHQALKINPDYADAHFNLGSLLARQGKYQEAMIHYTEVRRINPGDAQVHYKIGVILAHQGKNEEAVVNFTEALRIFPKYGEAHFALGMLYSETGIKDLALRHYRILKTINKNLADSLYKNISLHKSRK